MRVAQQVGQPRGEVDRLDIRHFEHKGVRTLHAGKADRPFPALSGFERHRCHLDLRTAYGTDFDIGFIYRLFTTAGSRDLHVSGSGGIFHTNAELRQFVTDRFKVQHMALLADYLHIAGAGDRDLHVSNSFFGGKDGSRNHHLLSYADNARECTEQHNRLAHEHALLRVAVSLPVSGDDHDADTAVVVRHLIGMLPFFSLFQQKRTGKLHDRLKAVHYRLRTFVQGIVAANAEQLLDAATIRADHVVVQIPGINPQCLAGVKRLPGIGGAKAG